MLPSRQAEARDVLDGMKSSQDGAARITNCQCAARVTIDDSPWGACPSIDDLNVPYVPRSLRPNFCAIRIEKVNAVRSIRSHDEFQLPIAKKVARCRVVNASHERAAKAPTLYSVVIKQAQFLCPASAVEEKRRLPLLSLHENNRVDSTCGEVSGPVDLLIRAHKYCAKRSYDRELRFCRAAELSVAEVRYRAHLRVTGRRTFGQQIASIGNSCFAEICWQRRRMGNFKAARNNACRKYACRYSYCTDVDGHVQPCAGIIIIREACGLQECGRARIRVNLDVWFREAVTGEIPVAACIIVSAPEWRNWQTRWTQNPMVLSIMRVRPPPPAPSFSLRYQPIRFSVRILRTSNLQNKLPYHPFPAFVPLLRFHQPTTLGLYGSPSSAAPNARTTQKQAPPPRCSR